MKRRPEECYDLIKNMTAHHNDWDTSAQRSKSYSSITSSFDPKIAALKAEMAEINKNLMRVLQPPLAKPRTYMLREPNKVVILTNLKMNTDSSSGLRTLPSNTITNPKEDLKGTTTRSRTAYQGPTIPTTSSSLPKVVERETEVTKDTPVVAPIFEPVVALKPNLKPSIPYPSRLHDQKLRDKDNDQKQKFFQIFQDLNFNICFANALILMPKFGPTIKTLFTNKDKLSELARTLLNEHCSAILLKKLQEKLGDPGKFLILCDFLGMDECLALADLDVSINLMPLLVWNKLSFPELSSMCMTLELPDHLISRPVGVVEDVFVKTRRDLIDVFKGELTLCIGKEAVTFNLDQTSRYSTNYNDMTTNRIDRIDMACEEYSQEVLSFFDVIESGNPTPYYDLIVSTSSLTLTPLGNSDFLLEEVDAFLALKDDPTSLEVYHSYFDTEGDILLLKAFLNNDPSLPLPNQGNYLPQDLPPHLEYAFFEGDDKLPVIIAKELTNEEKTALIKILKSHKRAIAWKLSDIRGGFIVVENEENESISTRLVTGWCVCIDYQKLNEATRKDHFPLPFMDQMLERLVENEYYCFLDGFSGYIQIPINPKDQEKTTFTCPYGRFPFLFMDDFSIFGNSFETCLSHLEKMLKRCEDTNLCLNWEKSHFMVKEGIVLGHKISKNEIEVDKAKVDVIAKLPHPTTVKGIRTFIGHAGFYRRFIQDFSKIARPMTRHLEKDTPFLFSKECVEAFQTLKRKLTESPILIAPDWDLPFELMCDASDFAIDSGCSKHMTGNRSQIMKFISKITGTVRFGNDQITKIMGYGVYHLGNIIISRNLDGVDLLSGSRDTNLYTISLDDMLKTSSICLLSKASKTKSWLAPLVISSQLWTPGTSSSGLVQNPVPQQPFNPPSKNDWDRSFQPMFDEYFNPPPSVVSLVQVAVTPRAIDIASSPSSTFIDQDAPSTSSLLTNQQQQSSIISQGVEEPIPNTSFDDPCHEPLYEISTSQESSLNGQSSHSVLELIGNMRESTLRNHLDWFQDRGHPYLHSKCRPQEYDDLPDGRQNGFLKWPFVVSNNHHMHGTTCCQVFSSYSTSPKMQSTQHSSQGKTEYQLTDIFAKALPQEIFNFLIEKLGMRSISLETLKSPAEEEDE
nr:reverse transcriptase domain-containing protein [Tanacetum cinerariifolium]